MFRLFDSINNSPILLNGVKENNPYVVGFPDHVAWYKSKSDLYVEAIVLALKSELSLIRYSIYKSVNNAKYLSETYRYLNQMKSSEIIYKNLNKNKNREFSQESVNEFNLQLIIDFLITINLFKKYNRMNDFLNIEKSLKSWLLKLRKSVLCNNYIDDWKKINVAFSSNNINYEIINFLNYKEKLSSLYLEISKNQTINLIEKRLKIPPHNSLVSKNCINLKSQSNYYHVTGINSSGLSGGALFNQNKEIVGMVTNSNILALGQRYFENYIAPVNYVNINKG